MSTFTIAVYQPTGANSRVPVIVPASLRVEPANWSAVAKGGKWDADIALRGPLAELTGLTAWLGYQVEIVNERGTPVWWGDIQTVEITADGLRRGISLDRMANRVMLRYSQRQPGGGVASADTAWTDDLLSQATYGVWERRITPEREMTTNEATALQATALTTLASPHYTLAIDGGEVAARLYCTGYWQRTKRSYYTETRGLEEHNVSGGDAYPLGLGVTSSSISFSNRAKAIAQLNGYFKNIADDYRIRISGSGGVAGNRQTYTVTGTDDRDAVVYSSTTVVFSPADDIQDAVGGLAFIENDDMFQITGSAANSGTHIMDKAGAVNVEVNGTFHGGAISSESAGPTVNFYRGNQITVTPTPTNETAGATVTATVWGQKYYQTFALSATGTWTVDTIEIRLQRIGGPVDTVKVELYTDSAGAPNTLLKSATRNADDIPLEMDWVAFDFDNAQAISSGTTYGLVISRTGANDWDDYYMVDMDVAGGYSGGSQKAYDGAAYQAINADLIFRAMGGVDTGTQAESILLAQSWPSVITTASSVVSNQYRDGEQRAYDELETLLDTGTSIGKRLCASVSPARAATIYAKPDRETAKWMLTAAGKLTDLFGQDAEPGYLPAGEWVEVGDASSLGPWAALSPIFVERAEYSATGGWNLEPENSVDPFDSGAMQG